MMFTAFSFFGILLACGPKKPAPAPSVMSREYNEPPVPLAPREFQLPEAERATLDNGIQVILSQNHEVPLVFINVVFEPGTWSENDDEQHISMSAMELIDNGAGDYTSDTFAQRQRELAASISAYAGQDMSGVSLSALRKNLDSSVELLSTMIIDPAFPKEDWEVERQQLIQYIEANQQKPTAVCANVFNNILYGGQYIGKIDSPSQLATIKTKDIKSWHKNNIVPANTKIAVAGAITLEEIQPILNAHFGEWTVEGSELPDKPKAKDLPELQNSMVYLVDKPGSAQSVVRFGQFTIPEGHQDYSALELANETIGGMFIARINMNLREDKGWTYGARSWHYPSFVTGRWTLSSNIITEHTAEAVAEIRRELRAAQEDNPIKQEELTAAQGNILGGFPQQFEQPRSLLNELLRLENYGLPVDGLKDYPEHVRGITLEQAQQAWNDYIDVDQLTIVIVGDAEKVEPGLLDQGLPVTRIDETGQPIK